MVVDGREFRSLLCRTRKAVSLTALGVASTQYCLAGRVLVDDARPHRSLQIGQVVANQEPRKQFPTKREAINVLCIHR